MTYIIASVFVSLLLAKISNKYNIELLEKHTIAISYQKNVFWQNVLDFPYFKWNYQCLSVNPNITFEIMQENKDKKWSWKYFSYNPNFKLEYI